MVAKARQNGAATVSGQSGQIVRLQPLELRHIEVDIAGVTPLIVHRFSEDTGAKIAGDQSEGELQPVKRAKPPRDPEREFEAARHRFPDGRDGFPAIGIKQAMVAAGFRFHGMVGTRLKGSFSLPVPAPGLLEIRADMPPIMRRDRVLIGSGPSRVTSLAYRPEYWPWQITVPIRFNAAQIELETIVELLRSAGFGVGIGDWRVEKDGDNGQWDIAAVRELR